MISAGVDTGDLAKRGESLIRQSSNRYLTTVRIAFRAKQRRFDDFDGLLEESSVKPVQRAIVEMSDEQDQPDLLPGGDGFRLDSTRGSWLARGPGPTENWLHCSRRRTGMGF